MVFQRSFLPDSIALEKKLQEKLKENKTETNQHATGKPKSPAQEVSPHTKQEEYMENWSIWNTRCIAREVQEAQQPELRRSTRWKCPTTKYTDAILAKEIQSSGGAILCLGRCRARISGMLNHYKTIKILTYIVLVYRLLIIIYLVIS